MLSIIIPSRKEKYLQNTIDELTNNSFYKNEIIVVLDGYWPDPPLTDNVKIVHYSKSFGLRNAVNKGVAIASNDYILKTDAHCMFDKHYDKKILDTIEDNWIVIPRRYRLDVEQWKITEDAPIDYEKVIFNTSRLHGVEWASRAIERKDVMIDEDPIFQGSCWVMSKKHYKSIGGLQEEGYGKFTQEPIELSFKTWFSGGKVMINKNTWYAHQHRRFKRAYPTNQEEVLAGNTYSYNYWMNDNNKDNIRWFREKFNI